MVSEQGATAVGPRMNANAKCTDWAYSRLTFFWGSRNKARNLGLIVEPEYLSDNRVRASREMPT